MPFISICTHVCLVFMSVNRPVSWMVRDTWCSQEVRINGEQMDYNLLINGVCWSYKPLILTIDPKFLGHVVLGVGRSDVR